MMKGLDVQADDDVKSFVVKQLKPNAEFVHALRQHPKLQETLSRNGDSVLALTDEQLIWRLVSHYVYEHTTN